MPTTAIDWLDAYNRMFSQAVQPLVAYNLEKRRLNEEARLRREALEDEARKRGYQLEDYAKQRSDKLTDIKEEERYQTERDLITSRRQEERDLITSRRQEERDIRLHQFDVELQEAAARRADAIQQREWDHADQVRKEEILTGLKAEAAQYGIPDPPIGSGDPEKSDFENRFDYYNRENNRARSKAVVALAKQGYQIEQQISQATNSSEQERAKLQMDIVLGAQNAEATKNLTADERKRLGEDPSSWVKIYTRLSQDQSRKGKANAAEFFQAVKDADIAAFDLYSKRSTASKETIEMLRNAKQRNTTLLQSQAKGSVLGEESIINMLDGMVDYGKQKQAAAAPQAGPGGGFGATFQRFSGGMGGSPATAPAPAPTVRSDIPALMAQDPYGALMGLMKDEARNAPVWVAGHDLGLATRTPIKDAWSETLAQKLGLQPEQVGSSVFSRTPGAQLMSNPALLRQLDAMPTSEANQLAYRTLGRIWNSLPPSDPTRLRLERFLRDNAAQQNAIAPTAFPAVQPPSPVDFNP